MTIQDYFVEIKQQIEHCPYVQSYDVTFDKRTDAIGFIKGVLFFDNEFELHIREFVDTSRNAKYKYAYHFIVLQL